MSKGALIFYEYITKSKKNQAFLNFLSLLPVLVRCGLYFYIHNMQNHDSKYAAREGF